MPALLARPGVQSLLLQQRSPSSRAQGQGTASRGHGRGWQWQRFPLALLLSSALRCSSHRGRTQALILP